MKVFSIFLILLMLLLPFTGNPYSESPQRIVAVGDIHGAYADFVAILQKAGVLDSKANWIAGKSILVQTGDFLDRGGESRAVMDLLMKLEDSAGPSGGKTVVILGNHEIMNIIGDLRYVSAGEYAGFSDAQSVGRQDQAYRMFVDYQKRRAEQLKQPAPVFNEQTEREWKLAHPPGFVEHREAFSAKGKYGAWLRAKPGVAQIGKIIFVHGGIDPVTVQLSVDGINRRVKSELDLFDSIRSEMIERKLILPFFNMEEMITVANQEVQLQRGSEKQRKRLQQFADLGNWLIAHRDGPFWFRGYDRWSQEQTQPLLQQLTDKYKADSFVVGHTPQATAKIVSRFNHKIFLIDTGMLSSHYRGGEASALVIENGSKFTAVYMHSSVPL